MGKREREKPPPPACLPAHLSVCLPLSVCLSFLRGQRWDETLQSLGAAAEDRPLALRPPDLFLSSPPGPSCVSVVSVSPEVIVVPGGTASSGCQDPVRPLPVQLLPVQLWRLNQSLTLTQDLTAPTPDQSPLQVLEQPRSPVPAPSPMTVPGCPVRRGWRRAGPGRSRSAEGPGSARRLEVWLGTPQSPGNPRSA